MDESTNLTFSSALTLLQEGHKVARSGWNGADMFIAVQIPDANSMMQAPYIYMSPVGGKLVPWVASHTDLLSNDWYVVA